MNHDDHIKKDGPHGVTMVAMFFISGKFRNAQPILNEI